MKLLLLGIILLRQWQHCRSYFQAQYGQVAPLQGNSDVCIKMMPPYIGRQPVMNRYPLNVEIDTKWISHKRVSVCAYSPPNRYQAFAGIMVQITKNNLPVGEFENDTKAEIVDCPPGKRVSRTHKYSSYIRKIIVILIGLMFYSYY